MKEESIYFCVCVCMWERVGETEWPEDKHGMAKGKIECDPFED